MIKPFKVYVVYVEAAAYCKAKGAEREGFVMPT